MKLYKLKDGGTIAASNPTEFLRELHAGSIFDSHGSDEEYMVRFARRLHTLDGSIIRSDNPKHFLDDLISSGFVIV